MKIPLVWCSCYTVTVALYPICIEYIGEDGSRQREAKAFLADKTHDHQQVRDFKFRASMRNWEDQSLLESVLQMVVTIRFG